MLTQEQMDDYLANSVRCPYCKDYDISAEGSLEFDEDVITRTIGCTRCGAQWDEVFTITGIIEIQSPEQNNENT